MEAKSLRLLLIILQIISLVFGGVGFTGSWHYVTWTFIANIFILFGFIIGFVQPPQPMIYIVTAVIEALFVLVCFIMAILLFVASASFSKDADNAKDQTSKDNNNNLATLCIVAGIFTLLDAFLCGVIAFFCFLVYKKGG